MIRILLIDDHPIVRVGYRDILEKSPDLRVVGEAGTGKEGLRLAGELHPDVVLQNVILPDMSGAALAQGLLAIDPGQKILVICANEDDHVLQDVLQTGVRGYISKEETSGMIREAVRSVGQGQVGWYSKKIAPRLRALREKQGKEGTHFTKREKDVLRLLVEGQTNAQMAKQLGIREKTVERYVVSIFEKMGVNSRTKAAVKALREKIV